MRAKSVVLMVSFVAAACGGGGTAGPEVSDARIGEPAGPNAALYFTATSSGPSDKLIAAGAEFTEAVEIHRSTTSDDGVAGMEQLDELFLPSGGRLVLEPGDYHLMLLGVERLDIGETVEVTLVWEKAGTMTIIAEVVDPAHTVGQR